MGIIRLFWSTARMRPMRRSPTDAGPPTRNVARWGDVELLIAHAEPRVRAAVVMQAHIGASPGRVLALRVGDLFLQDAFGSFCPAGKRGGRATRAAVRTVLHHDARRSGRFCPDLFAGRLLLDEGELTDANLTRLNCLLEDL